jgi:PAS domain S-box-containing protein
VSGENEVNFQFLAENNDDIICRAGMDRVLFYVSRTSLYILGWKPEEMTGRPVDEFIVAEDFPILAGAIARHVKPGVEVEAATIRMLKKDGTSAWMDARLLRDPATGEPKEFVVVMRYIAESKKLEEQLSALALTDGLIWLSNRRAFDEALARVWKRNLRACSQDLFVAARYRSF